MRVGLLSPKDVTLTAVIKLDKLIESTHRHISILKQIMINILWFIWKFALFFHAKGKSSTHRLWQWHHQSRECARFGFLKKILRSLLCT